MAMPFPTTSNAADPTAIAAALNAIGAPPSAPPNPLDPDGVLAALAAIGSPAAAPPASPPPTAGLTPAQIVARVQMDNPHGGPDYAHEQPSDEPAPSTGDGYNGDYQWLPFLTSQAFDPTLPNYSPGSPNGPAPSTADLTPEQARAAAVAAGFAPTTAGQTPGQLAAGVTMDEPPQPAARPGGGSLPASANQPALDGMNGADGFSPAPFLPGALGNEDTALANESIAARNLAGAKLAADRDVAARRAQADEDYARGLQDAQVNYQRQRVAAEQSADAETSAWLQKYQALAQQEPNPHRWWDNESGFGKALWLMGLAFSSAHAAITPGARNVALDMMQQEIDRDVQLQRERLQKSLDVMKAQGRVMDQREQRNLTDLTDDHTMTLGRLQALHQAYLDRAAVPGGPQAALAAAQANSFIADKVATVASARRQQAARAKQAEAERGLQWSIAKLTDDRERKLGVLRANTALDVAQVGADERLAAAKAKGNSSTIHLSPDNGMRLVDAKTGQLVGDGGVDVDKAMKPDQVMATVANANKQLYDLQKAKEALQGDGWFNVVTGTDPRLNQAMSDLKLLQSQGRLSHSSQALLDLYAQQIAGLNPQGDKTDRAKAEIFKDGMLQELDEHIANHKLETENQLNGLPHPAGTHIRYTAQSVEAPAKPNLTAADELAAQGDYSTAAPQDTEQFRAAKAGDHPLKYDTEAERQALAAFDGASPATIDKLAARWTDPWANRGPGDKDWSDFPYADAATDPTTRLAVQAAADTAKRKAAAALNALEADLHAETGLSFGPSSLQVREEYARAAQGDREARAELAKDIKHRAAKDYGLTDLTGDDIDRIIRDTAPAWAK